MKPTRSPWPIRRPAFVSRYAIRMMMSAISTSGLGFSKLVKDGAPRPDPVRMAEVIEPAHTETPATEKPSDKNDKKSTSSSSTAVDVQLQVQVLGAAPSALEELFRPADSSGRADIFQALAVKRPTDLSTVLRNLEQLKSVDVISTSQVRTGVSSSVSLASRPSGSPCRRPHPLFSLAHFRWTFAPRSGTRSDNSEFGPQARYES